MKRIHSPGIEVARKYWNPLIGLTVGKAVGYLQDYEASLYANPTWLFRHVEKREATVRSIKERRLAALGRLEWTIQPTQEGTRRGSEDQFLKEQKSAAEEAFGRIRNLRGAWKWLGMATFRGFAHLEKEHDSKFRVVGLDPVPQWFFCRRYPSTRWVYDPMAADNANGREVLVSGAYSDMIVREVDDPIGFVSAIKYVQKNVGERDWDAFNSIFGIPNVVAYVADLTMGKTDQAMMNEIFERLREMVGNGRLVLPPGWKVEMLAAAASQSSPFKDRIEYIDTMLVLAGTGGKLTMLSDSTGIGQGATSAHEGVFSDLASQEAAEISEILDEAILQPELEFLFGEEAPQLVEFKIREAPQSDPKENADLMWKVKLGGWRIQQEDAEKMIGVKLTELVDPLSQDGTSGFSGFAANRGEGQSESDARVDGAVRLVERAMKEDLSDIVNEVMGALDKPKGERDAALKKLEQRLPAMLKEANEKPRSADAFEEAIAGGFEEGFD